MIRKVLGIILLLIALAVVAWLVFTSYPESDTAVWKAIPEDAAIIIEINDPLELCEKLNSENEIWANLSANDHFEDYEKDLEFIENLFYTSFDAEYRTKGLPVLLSFHVNADGGISTLALMQAKEKLVFNKLLEKIKKTCSYRPLSGVKNAGTIVKEESTKELFFGFKKNLIIATYDRFLFNESIKNISSTSEHFSDQPGFISLYETGGSKVDARIYIHYKHLGPFLGIYSNPQFTNALQWLNSFAQWTEVDVKLKEKEVLMTGFTTVDSSGHYFLDQLSTREPVQNKAFNIIPFNTNLLLSYGIPKGYVSAADPEAIRKKLNVDPAELFDQLDGEIALVSNSTYGSDDNHWFMARVNNPERMGQLLEKMSTNSSGNSKKSGKYLFRQVNYDGLIPDLFGAAFSSIKNNWYFFIEDFVIFGNSTQSLTNFGRYYETGKTLDLYEGFEAINDNISSNSNLLLLIKPRELLQKPGTLLSPEALTIMENYSSNVNSLQGLAIQFSNSDPFIYSNFYLLNNQQQEEANLAVWQTVLDGKISRKPFLVKDHKTGMFNILAFDDAANMYLISSDGRILWKKRIDALPESPIYQVDYYKNRKIQYLFNSRDFIYLVDKNGENVANYPKKLNPSATNGISLFDYNNNKDYRLMVAQSDKRIYNYTIKGNQVKGWSKPKTANVVADPLTRLVAGNKDYIIINDIDNNISIINRRGNRRIKLKENPRKAGNSSFYINKTNSKGILITTNQEGKLTYIDNNGNLKYTDFGDFSPIHFFLYEDFNGDGAQDFIYVDGTELKVFDRFKNVLFTFSFESTISIKPEFFSLGRNQKVLGIVADEEKTVYLFDKKGNTIISRGLVSETPFTVGSIENADEINLLTAAGHILYNYRLN